MADSSNQAMLFNRLNKYGSSQPRSLVAPQRRPTSSAQLAPLPAPPLLQSPALRQKRGKSDAALSSTSLHDAAAMAASGSKASLQAGVEVLSASAPMPFTKMAKVAQALPPPPPPVPATPGSANGAAGAPANGAKGGDAGGAVKRDPFWFIQMLRTELAEHEFAYMNYADTQGTTWDPYDLKIVPFHEVDTSDHYTISEAGVTHCIRKGKVDVTEFTPLEQWETEAGQFKEVMEIPFFKRYQSWKAYTSWKGAIKKDKMAACSAVLTNHLFVLNTTFQPSLLKVRQLCVELSLMKLHKIRVGATYTLDAFVTAQEEHKALTCEKLEQFFEAVREAVQGACNSALDRFEREESAQPPAAAAGPGQSTPRPGKGGEVVKRSFLQQAQLRSVCKKITNYIRVVDYIVLSTLHQLLMSSLNDLLYMFESVTPGYVEPQRRRSRRPRRTCSPRPARTARSQAAAPLPGRHVLSGARLDRVLAVGARVRAPIDATISEFVNMLKMVGTLITHDAFTRYTQPVINGRQDSVEINEGFDIVGLIDDNDEYNNVCEGIKSSFEHALCAGAGVRELLEPHTAIYLENEGTRHGHVRRGHPRGMARAARQVSEQERMFKLIPLAATVGIFAREQLARQGALHALAAAAASTTSTARCRALAG